jgi:hypothetical protein
MFMIIYGSEPSTALDIHPLPLHERTNRDFAKHATVANIGKYPY